MTLGGRESGFGGKWKHGLAEYDCMTDSEGLGLSGQFHPPMAVVEMATAATPPPI